jgi:hypothetical protein
MATMSITGFRESPIVINQHPSCKWEKFYLHLSTDRAFPGTGDNYSCIGATFVETNNSFATTMPNGTLAIFVPSSAFDCFYNDQSWLYALLIVSIVVSATGVTVGMVLGVKRYKRRQRAKLRELEMAEQARRMDPMEQCSAVNKD